MSAALLSTLPGDIPGLLRRGSPVLYTAGLMPGVVVALVAEELGSHSDPPILSVALFGQHVLPDRCIDVYAHDRQHLVLDLADPTGRAHAAWWAVLNGWGPAHTVSIEDVAVVKCERGEPVTSQQVDLLVRLCLRLAGRAS